MSATPGVECRVRAIHGQTLLPGRWPPSPGFAPCASLIWISLALTRYSLVTPNRPEATCLMAEFSSVPSLAGSSRLAGVGLSAQAIHRNGKAAVRFFGDGAVGHGAGFEAFDDAGGWLDLAQRNCLCLVKPDPSRPRSVCGSNSSSTMAEYLRKHAKSPVRTAFCSVRTGHRIILYDLPYRRRSGACGSRRNQQSDRRSDPSGQTPGHAARQQRRSSPAGRRRQRG